MRTSTALTSTGTTTDTATTTTTDVHAAAPTPAPSSSAASPPDLPIAPTTLLHLMRLASPSLPVGGFSYSEGLESAVNAGRVRDADSAAAWLADQLHLVLARAELPVLAEAVGAWARDDDASIDRLNHWTLATRETAELRLQTEQMGRSLAELLRRQRPSDARIERLVRLAPAPTWPIAFAFAAVDIGASARDAMLAFAFGWAENLVQAALKAVPLGQHAAQRALAALIDAMPDAIDRAAALPAGDRQAFAPMLAILSSRHEVQYSRLFRS